MKRRNQFLYNLRPGTTVIQGKIPIGSGGAIGTVSIPGVTSVVRANTGLLTVNLEDRYLGLVGWDASIETGASGADGYSVQMVDSQYIDGGEVANSGNGYVQIETLNASHAVADALLCSIWLTLHLKTSDAG